MRYNKWVKNYTQTKELSIIDTKISKQTNDIIQKYTSGLFRNASLEFYGIKAARIKELINVELPVVEVTSSNTDIVFLLEDNTYLHFEFQTTYNKDDITRFARYDLRLFERDKREINTVIIYTASVKNADTSLAIGSLAYNPSKVMMCEYDGNAIFDDLDRKIKAGHELTDEDMLNLVFVPLMRNNIPVRTLAENSIRLAKTIKDTTKRNFCIAAVFAFASKYLGKNEANKLLEVLRMTDLAAMFVEEGIQKGIERGIQKGIEEGEKKGIKEGKKEGIKEGIKEGMQKSKIVIAKNLLQEGGDMDFIMRITGLDEATIKTLQNEAD